MYLYSRHAYLVHRTEQLVTTGFASAPLQKPLTVIQLHFLQILQAGGEMSQARLARISGADPSTTSLVLSNLAKAALVVRRPDTHDRRQKLVRLTDTGVRLAAEGASEMQKLTAELLSPLGKSQVRLSELLSRLAPIDAQLGDSEQHAADPAVCTALLQVVSAPSFALRRVLQLLDAMAAQALAATGVTIRQFTVLHLVANHRGITEAGLVRFGGFEASNTAFLVNLLKDGGHIALGGGSAGKRKRYIITEAGMGSMRLAGAALIRAEAASLSGLRKREAREIQQLLAHIIARQNRGPDATLPLFPELSDDPRWPIAAGEIDFAATMATALTNPLETCEPKALQSSQSILLLLKLAELAVASGIERQFQPLGVSLVEYVALCMIGDALDYSNGSIAHQMPLLSQIDAATVSSLLEKGLVAEKPNAGPTHRHHLMLTDTGRMAFAACTASLAQLEARLIGDVPDRDKAELRHSLQLLIGIST